MYQEISNKRGNSGFIYQLIGTLAMQAKVDDIFLPKLPLMKLFSIVISKLKKTSFFNLK